MWSSKKLRLPAVFGRYVLIHRISRGGMGEIFLGKLGEIRGFEKPIVVKKLLPALSQDQEFLQKFVQEAQITIKLAHGNVVQVYEVGMVDGEYFLAMEFVDGRDLRSLGNRCEERRYRLPPDICLYLVREVANGLAYAHRRSDEKGRPLHLVHCDISPPNVLVSYEGEVKVIDFGIARSAVQRAKESQDMAFGKFGYMAPEQLLRGAEVDRRADIYSTGVLLHELLTGRRLFNFSRDTPFREVARVVTAGRIAPPSVQVKGLNDGIDALVMRALRTDARDRFQSAEELRDAVQQQLYAMNPTISADDLAGVMRELFRDEQKASQQVLRLLTRTRIEPLQVELHDASSHTVSYALSEGWSGEGTPLTPHTPHTPLTPLPLIEPRSAPTAPPGEGRRSWTRGHGETVSLRVVGDGQQGAPEGTGGQGPGTRRLSRPEKIAAVASTPPVNHTASIPLAPPLRTSRRRIGLWIAIAAAALGTSGVLLGVHLAGPAPATDPAPAAIPARGGADGAAGARSSPAEPPPAAGSAVAKIGPDGAVGQAGDRGPPLTFNPEPVHLSDGPAAPARQPERRKGRAVRRKAAARPSTVQAKFRQVRQEYEQFTRSNGKLLEREWQQILFASTYDTADQDRFQKLDTMLDSLRRKMRETGR